MKITDLNGMEFTITDLDTGIAMVEGFLSYTHSNSEEFLQRFEQQQLLYWTDIHQKLLLLKANQNNNNQ